MKAETESKEHSGSSIREVKPQRSIFDLLRNWEVLLVVLIVIVVVVNTGLSPYFLNAKNLLRTSSDFMEIV